MKLFDSYPGEGDPKAMPQHLFFDARSMDYSTAKRADISKQNYTVCPRHWYVDATFVCHDCGREFVFSATEQRFWYEDMRFYVDSLPKRCATCRKAERASLSLRKRYDELIGTALGGRCPSATKKEILQIVDELEAAEETVPDKMKENRIILMKQLAKTSDQP